MHGDVLISGKMIEGVVTRAETTNCRRAAVDLKVNCRPSAVCSLGSGDHAFDHLAADQHVAVHGETVAEGEGLIQPSSVPRLLTLGAKVQKPTAALGCL